VFLSRWRAGPHSNTGFCRERHGKSQELLADTEGFWISLIKAMACEVLATRHNGFVETVEQGLTGLLVDGHDVERMALAELLDGRAKAMGNAGRQRVLDDSAPDRPRDCLQAIIKRLPLAMPESNATGSAPQHDTQ
jgi:glycosyltransferase involved in cell wall biosynthesis